MVFRDAGTLDRESHAKVFDYFDLARFVMGTVDFERSPFLQPPQSADHRGRREAALLGDLPNGYIAFEVPIVLARGDVKIDLHIISRQFGVSGMFDQIGRGSDEPAALFDFIRCVHGCPSYARPDESREREGPRYSRRPPPAYCP